MDRAVYVNEQVSLSSAGTSAELLRGYERGEIALEVRPWGGAPAGRLLGQFPDRILGPRSDAWSSAVYPRWQSVLRTLLDQVAAELKDRSFDGVLVGRPRLKMFHPGYFREDMDAQLSPTGFVEFLKRELEARGFSLKGSVVSVETSCTTGVTLLSQARQRVRCGIWDRVLLIAFDPITPAGVSVMEALGVLSKGPGLPHVFHQDRDGFVRGEAACATVVSAEHELGSRSPLVLGHVALSNDASALTAMESDGSGLRQCIEQCLERSGSRPEISFIKAHGTGTPMNDLAESRAILAADGGSLAEVPVIGFKSQFGHTTNAGGLFELALASHCLRENLLMPVPNSDPPDPEIRLNVVRSKLSGKSLTSCLGLTMGFGGINGVYLLEKAEA